MSIMTDAELLLGLSRHLSAYNMSAERASLDELEFAGQIFDMAFRLRGSTTSSPERVNAIGLEVGLSARTLRDVVVALESLGWVSVARDAAGSPVAVSDLIPAPRDLINAATRVLDVCLAKPAQWALLSLLRATTVQPLLVVDALEIAADSNGRKAGAEAAEDALRKLIAVGLARRVSDDDGRDVIYNPNVWVQGDSVATAALKAADAKATAHVTALLEEVAANPALPEGHVTSTEPRWVSFAVAQGLVHRSVIQTSEGSERAFLFTPHLSRDPFGSNPVDASGQVKQLVGSMVYAQTYAEYKLHSPGTFLRKLIDTGVAGNVTSIGTDYPMLEKAGIVRVIPGSSSNRFRLELLQSDVAESALELIEVRDDSTGNDQDAAALRAQRSYIHTERDRAQLALTTEIDEVEQRRLVAALREIPTKRTFGGRP